MKSFLEYLYLLEAKEIFSLALILLLVILLIAFVLFSFKSKKVEQKVEDYSKGVEIILQIPKEFSVSNDSENFFKIRVSMYYLQIVLLIGIMFSSSIQWLLNDELSIEALLHLIVPFFALLLLLFNIFFALNNTLSFIVGLFFLIASFILSLPEALYGVYTFSILLMILSLYRKFYRDNNINKTAKVLIGSRMLMAWAALSIIGVYLLSCLFWKDYLISMDISYLERYWFVLLPFIFALLLLILFIFKLKIKAMAFLTGFSIYVLFVLLLINFPNYLFYENISMYVIVLFGTLLLWLSLRKNMKVFTIG